MARLTLASEPDVGIEDQLSIFLARHGATEVDRLIGTAGSVDLDARTYRLEDGRVLKIERDNWVAILLDGEAELLAEVVHAVSQPREGFA